MRSLMKRLDAIDVRNPAPVTVHLIGKRRGQSDEDAIASYGKPVGPDDEIIFLMGVGNADE